MNDVARLRQLLDQYWNLAVAEGQEGREHDTATGAAQRCRDEIDRALCRLEGTSPSQVAPANPAEGVTSFDAVELDIIRNGDMLGSKLGERVYAALTAAIGAGGQAVACNHDWEKTREDACMFVCSKCRVAYNGNVLTDKPKGWTGKYQGSSSITAHPAHNGQGGL